MRSVQRVRFKIIFIFDNATNTANERRKGRIGFPDNIFQVWRSWVHIYTPPPKSKVWCGSAWMNQLWKIPLTVFWDAKGVIYLKHLPPGSALSVIVILTPWFIWEMSSKTRGRDCCQKKPSSCVTMCVRIQLSKWQLFWRIFVET